MKLGEVFTDDEVARLYAYRPAYPEPVFEILARLLVPPRAILDAGAGTGMLARELVRFAERVDAVDPSAAMVEIGRRLPRGTDPRIRWIVGRAEDAELSPPYGLITCGASLHWMDLDVVLPRFRDALAPGAVLAIADTENVRGAYREDVLAVIRQYSEVEDHVETKDLVERLRREGRVTILHEERTAAVPVEQSVDDFIHYLHSTSTLARIRLQERSERFDAEVRAVFARHGMDRVRSGVIGYVAWGRPA